MRRLAARDGTAEPVSRDPILRRERGQGNLKFRFPFSADREQDWQLSYPFDPYNIRADYAYINTLYINT